MTEHDLIAKIANRIKVLDKWPLPKLQYEAAQTMSGSQLTAYKSLANTPRAELMDLILHHEFGAYSSASIIQTGER